MVVCPYDCHWCHWSHCRTYGCRITAEPALLACAECGTLIMAPAPTQICIECVAIAVREPAGTH
jgi:hypothetical protein